MKVQIILDLVGPLQAFLRLQLIQSDIIWTQFSSTTTLNAGNGLSKAGKYIKCSV